MAGNIKSEIRTLERMMSIYCRGKHGGERLCPDCGALLVYAAGCIINCPRDPKPACKACPSNCYAPEKRALIREVMRYSGPKMLFRHPLLTLRHYLRL